MMRLLTLILLTISMSAEAGTVIAKRPIRNNAVIVQGDLDLAKADVPGALTSLEGLVGQEARVNLYPGKPVYPGDVGPAAILERNQIVTLSYQNSGLSIFTEGRALDRAGAGERVRVMNIDSRTVVTGVVTGPGSVAVKK